MDTIHQLIIGIGHPVTLQDRFSQPAQNASLDRMKPEPVDQQSRRLSDDFVLEEELGWLEAMVGKVRFQLEEGMEPGAVTGKNGRSILHDGEGGFGCCRHGFELHVIAQPTRGDTHTPKACSSWSGLRFYLDTVTRDGGFELRFLPGIRYTDGRRIDFMGKGRITITP
jgi:hypothetical protein